MEISPTVGVLIMMNNYFHDVATALLIVSAFALWVLMQVQKVFQDHGAVAFFLEAQRRFTFLVKAALVWIVLGGIPRTIFFRDFEWANAAGKGQVAAIIVKHVLVVVLLTLGTWGWLRLKKRVRELEAEVVQNGRG